ncbi:MAG TPA: caspase family protein [Candidatus Methanomethylophilaceae archaeon]|nr:caspase family protein [Candidatus Methanomethylophilaceae archaeon]
MTDEIGKALSVGIDCYGIIGDLSGCENDAQSVSDLLSKNEDSTPNFNVKTLLSKKTAIDRAILKKELEMLFSSNVENTIFYFAGHGHIDEYGGYILTPDCTEGDDGLSMDDLSKIVGNSRSRNKIVILDCCHSGCIGNNTLFAGKTLIPDGTTYLTACTEEEVAKEENGNGLFTSLLTDGLRGGASNILGQISPGSLYSYIDQSLSLYEQRPVFKTNIERFICIRKVHPPIERSELRKISILFRRPDNSFQLDTTYEFTNSDSIEENVSKFKTLQKMERVGLVAPSTHEHMYEEAMKNGSCKLTLLGKHYWKLANEGRI